MIGERKSWNENWLTFQIQTIQINLLLSLSLLTFTSLLQVWVYSIARVVNNKIKKYSKRMTRRIKYIGVNDPRVRSTPPYLGITISLSFKLTLIPIIYRHGIQTTKIESVATHLDPCNRFTHFLPRRHHLCPLGRSTLVG